MFKSGHYFLFIIIFMLLGCSAEPEPNVNKDDNPEELSPINLTYPVSVRGAHSDTYYNVSIPDPYRWLETTDSQQSLDWITAQNQLTEKYLSNISFHGEIKARLAKLMDYEQLGVPSKHGAYQYFQVHSNSRLQTELKRTRGDASAEVFLAQGSDFEIDNLSIHSIRFSQDGRYAALSVPDKNSTQRQIIVIDTETKQSIGEEINDISFTEIAWRENEGFYYSKLAASANTQTLYFHEIGTEQKDDKIIFGDLNQKYRYISADVTADDEYLLIQAANSTSGNKLYLLNLTTKNAQPVEVMNDNYSDTFVIAKDKNYFYLMTNSGATNNKVVRMPVNSLNQNAWQDVIPETDHVLNVFVAAGYFFAEYKVDAKSKLYQYDFSGKNIAEIRLPESGSLLNLQGSETGETVYYNFTSYRIPPTIYELDVKTHQSRIFSKPQIAFNSDDYISKQIFYESKDGTPIPMTITHHKNTQINSDNPTLLYGYGGFNISLTPIFSEYVALWLELGGVYAVPNIRGGGEYGKTWHLAGTKLQKQKVFEDFISAAEYLIKNKYTSQQKLAIQGASNGGLTIGAVVTQRPDLAKIALPEAGVLDMLRYHKQTSGLAWAYDYGTVEESETMFKYLLDYSPVHNVKPDIFYPAILVSTSQHDDHVSPFHSYKFTAELQAKQSADLPVLIRIGTQNTSRSEAMVAYYTDIISFTLFNMGIETLN